MTVPAGWDDPDLRDAALERVLARVLQPDPLTKHELAAVFLLSHGLRYDRIAQMLYLSPDTVRTYAAHAREKLGATTKEQAVATALRLGLID